jgi:hypothetical protein
MSRKDRRQELREVRGHSFDELLMSLLESRKVFVPKLQFLSEIVGFQYELGDQQLMVRPPLDRIGADLQVGGSAVGPGECTRMSQPARGPAALH